MRVVQCLGAMASSYQAKDEFCSCCTNPRHNTPEHDVFSKQMQYSWHPFFGKTFDIHLHFARASAETYRCRPSSRPGQMRLDMPVWMFDATLCSKMKLSEKPYCCLDSLKQLLLLLSEVSSSECIIGQSQDTFSEKGDAHAESPPAAHDSGHASIPPPRSLSNDMERFSRTVAETTEKINQQDTNGISKASGRGF